MPYFTPKALIYEAVTHDGTEQSAQEVAHWLINHDEWSQAHVELMHRDKHKDNYYVVVYTAENSYDVIVPGSWLLWRGDGSFIQYDEQEFKSLFEPTIDAIPVKTVDDSATVN